MDFANRDAIPALWWYNLLLPINGCACLIEPKSKKRLS